MERTYAMKVALPEARCSSRSRPHQLVLVPRVGAVEGADREAEGPLAVGALVYQSVIVEHPSNILVL